MLETLWIAPKEYGSLPELTEETKLQQDSLIKKREECVSTFVSVF